MRRQNAMKLILIVFLNLHLSETAVGGSAHEQREDEHLTSVLKRFMLYEEVAAVTATGPSTDVAFEFELGGERRVGKSEGVAKIMATTTERPNSPYFEDMVDNANVTSQLGSTVTLHCRVRNSVNQTVVSWIRRTDGMPHLLAYGHFTYASDERYATNFRPPNDWQLRIRYANQRDQGHYECHVPSPPPPATATTAAADPHSIVYRVFLKILAVPQLEIADEREWPITRTKFYDAGSTIELKCAISNVQRRPDAFVTWRHGDRVLNYDTIRGGINVKTQVLADGARSRLLVANARTSDSGNYSCALAEGAATHVAVQVLNGETPAAMQHGAGSHQRRFHKATTFLLLVWIVERCR